MNGPIGGHSLYVETWDGGLAIATGKRSHFFELGLNHPATINFKDKNMKIRVRSLTSSAFTSSICSWTLAPNAPLKLRIEENTPQHTFKYIQYR